MLLKLLYELAGDVVVWN